LSQISALRAENNNEITIYINSCGGSVLVLNHLSGLLDSSDLDKNFCRSITVALGMAASAGAHLLAFGDYAYAYSHSYIHFHGVRTSELPEKYEDAAQVMTQLARTQREVSLKLSSCLIHRVIYRYLMLRDGFKMKRKDVPDKALVGLKCFIDAIAPKLSPLAGRMVSNTFSNVEEARSLTRAILPRVNVGRRARAAKGDSKVLIEVIQHELREHGKSWRIDEVGAQQILADYFLLRDYNMDKHWQTFFPLIDDYGEDFLTPSERKQFQTLEQSNSEQAKAFLREKSFPRMEPLWYYTICLCRSLFSGENRLTAADSFWMGIIDEVIGTKLVGFRSVAERRRPPTSSSTSGPQPPSSQSATAPQQ